jgi:hypothetical protein
VIEDDAHSMISTREQEMLEMVAAVVDRQALTQARVTKAIAASPRANISKSLRHP